MNIENELKLIPKKEITQQKLIEVLRRVGIHVPQKGKTIHQEDTYFDDKTGTLEKTGGSFRIRRKGDKTQVTYKIPVESDTQYKQRREYEIVVPKEYEDSLDVNLAMKLLKEQYPELSFPRNMAEILTVINDRNKLDLTCPDGTVLEMAFDSLHGRDERGILYDIRPEIEFETISGNPENLTGVYEIVLNEFPSQTQRNTLSKYARTKKEIQERKLTLDEISTCAIFSQILNSTQFEKLRYKGQVLHRYDRPTIPQLDNFKNFDYLIDRIARIKSGEYKIPVPKNIAEKENLHDLLESGIYEIKEEIDLEDMFCLLLSDAHYEVADEVLADFLDKKYFEDDKAMTNRLSHSQQVMLGTGLICKSSQVRADLGERLTAMVSALSHDIGHVPYSHIMEEKLQEKIGSFSHDNNGAVVLEEIYNENLNSICRDIQRYYGKDNKIDVQKIKDSIKDKKSVIQMAIREHSRTNAEKRGKGIIVQAPREADKIQYIVSDIRDLQKFLIDQGMQPADFFSEEFVDTAMKKICKDKEYEADDVREKIEGLFIEPIKSGKYGRAAVNVINTVKYSRYDQNEYYDVDQDLWKFIEATIANVKKIRKDRGFDDTRPSIKRFSGYIATKIIVENRLKKNQGNRQKAREEGLHEITNMGELDGVAYARKELANLSPEKIAMLKNGDYTQLSPQEIYEMKKTTYGLLARVLIQTGHGSEEELNALAKEVHEYDLKELVETFLNAPVITKIDEQRLEQFKVEDVQLKIVPGERVNATSVLRNIAHGDVQYSSCEFEDCYYENNLPNKTLCHRIFAGEDRAKLKVKEKLPKKVSEIIRNTYEIEGNSELTPQELVQKLNEKYPGLNAEIIGQSPYKHLSIHRMQWTFIGKSGEKVELREDFGYSSNVKTGERKPVHQIEIKADARDIKVIKKKLLEEYGNSIFTQETKEGGTQHRGNLNGDGR